MTPAQQFIAALERGALCLSPTDTLPGLSFHPALAAARAAVVALKGRSAAQSFIGLVADAAMALAFVQDPGEPWQQALTHLWPAPLSVIFKASEACPVTLCAPDGSVALRVPKLGREDAWLYDVMRALALPLPSTSVNVHGHPPAAEWPEALAWAEQHGCAVPVSERGSAPNSGLPSTIIRISGRLSFDVVRAGAVNILDIKAALT